MEDARKRLPNEACGILSGKGDLATTFFSMKNTEGNPSRYLMDSKEQFRVVKQIRENNETMQAIYHSHVASRAYPSSTDVQLAFYPGTYYVIVSLENRVHPVAKAFRIREGSVQETPLQVVS